MFEGSVDQQITLQDGRLHRQALPIYFLLAYLISWLIWLPLVLVGQGWVDRDFSPYLQPLGFMGPMFAAVIVTAVSQHRAGIRQLLSGLVRYRVNWRWYAFALFVPLLMFVIAAALNYALMGEWSKWQDYGRMDDMFPNAGLVGTAVLHFLMVWLGEEVGWRGFALPHLQSTRTPVRATLILGVLWGFWHMPTFLFENSLLVGLGITLFFTLITFPIAVTYTWLYNGTGGSLLITSLWSTSLTLGIGSAAAIGAIPIIMMAIIFIIAMILINKTGSSLGWQDNVPHNAL